MTKFDGVLFHVVRCKKVCVGEKFNFTNRQNYFARNMFNQTFSTGNLDVNQLIQLKSLKELNMDEQSLVKSYINQSCLMLRELILEQVRITHFHQLPSRLNCMFCTKSYQEAKNWLSALKRMNSQNPPLQIVKLKAMGEIFEGDGNLMLRNTFSLNSKIEMAEDYWNQTSMTLPEILFTGQAEVIEILDEL